MPLRQPSRFNRTINGRAYPKGTCSASLHCAVGREPHA